MSIALQSALTGESLPVTKHPGGGVYSGSTCKQGEIEAVVIATGIHTFFGKAAHLVESTTHVGHFQKVEYYSAISVSSASLVSAEIHDMGCNLWMLSGSHINRKLLHLLHCHWDDYRVNCHGGCSTQTVPPDS